MYPPARRPEPPDGYAPLPESVRRFMEPRFGQPFDRVRIHAGRSAERLNRSVSARAFTLGHDIFFRPAEFKPDTSAGRRLLAQQPNNGSHELFQAGAAVALRWKPSDIVILRD